MSNKFYLFSKHSCGPCRLVDKYFDAMDDTRISIIEKIDLEDVSDTPIPQKSLDLAKFYGVTATPVLIIATESGLKIKQFVGGVEITKNIKQMLDEYA